MHNGYTRMFEGDIDTASQLFLMRRRYFVPSLSTEKVLGN